MCSEFVVIYEAGWRLGTWLFTERPQLNSLHGPCRKHSLSIVLKACLQSRCISTEVTWFCLRIRCRGNIFTDSLPSNEPLLWLHYSGFRASYHSIIKLTSGSPIPWAATLITWSLGFVSVILLKFQSQFMKIVQEEGSVLCHPPWTNFFHNIGKYLPWQPSKYDLLAFIWSVTL
jgi:hypothetical protein